MEFVYIILLGDEYVVDLLESQDVSKVKAAAILKLSSVAEGVYLLAKQN